jgi:hypothetical protein
MAAVLPATLFAQVSPVEQASAAPVVPAITTPVLAPPAIAAVQSAAMTSEKAKPAVTAVKHTAPKRATAKAVVKRTTATKTATVKPATVKPAVASSTASDLDTAEAVLASLKARYQYLSGVTVSMGKTPGGYQAVSYYTRGRILISTAHRATISRILQHEIWHIIDWRDNGKIDWGESVPPHNAADYLK